MGRTSWRCSRSRRRSRSACAHRRARAGEAADGDGHGRRGRERRPARDAGRDRRARARRQRVRRGGRRGGRARRGRAVLLRHRRRRLHGHPHGRQRQDHDDRLAREGAGDDAARLVLQTASRRRTRSSRSPATAGCRSACPARRGVGLRAAPATARSRSRKALQLRRSTSRADGFVVDQTFFDQTTPATGRTSTTSRRPRRSTSTPTARRRTSARRSSNPDMAQAPTSCIGRLGATKGFYRGPVADAIAKAVAQTRRSPRPPTTTWRPGLMTDGRPRATTRSIEREPVAAQLPRRRRLRHGPAVLAAARPSLEALNILQDFQRRGVARPDARTLLPLPRGRRARVRRPQRLPRRPGVRRHPDRGPAVATRSPPSARALIGPTRADRRRSPPATRPRPRAAGSARVASTASARRRT